MSRKFNTNQFIKNMDLQVSQDEISHIIISDMVKKRGSIVPVIGEDTIVYPFCVHLILLWLSRGKLKWIRSAFEDGLNNMRRYTLFMNIGRLTKPA